MGSEHRIAIIGIGLRYPDAATPGELWENMLSARRPYRAGRRAHGVPTGHAAAGRLHRLALDVATAALTDAGFSDGAGLPRAATSVVLGNSGGSGATGACHAALAGGLCDHFDLGGGGFTVGTGGTATLLPVIAAAAALIDHDVDVALAGTVGPCVDHEDRFDGTGLLVLMRESDALARNLRIYASITGGGVASESHTAAVDRAYRRTGYGVDTVPYLADGDGIAGLVRAVLAVHHQVIPPAAGLAADVLAWPVDRPVRAGVSARGTGVYTHVAIEEPPGRQHGRGLAKRTLALAAGRQDAELLLLAAPDLDTMRARATELAARVLPMSGAELTDLAGILAAELCRQPVRAAVVATDPADAHRKLTKLAAAIGHRIHRLHTDGIYLDDRGQAPRIAYLFPGHRAGTGTIGAIRRRFALADNIVRIAGSPVTWTQHGTPNAAPSGCVVAAALAATRVLRALGVDADIATGPGLGELTALAWAGAIGGTDLLRIAASPSPATEFAATRLAEPTREIVPTGGPLAVSDETTAEAVGIAVADADLVVEVGPGRAMTDLAHRIAPATPALAVDTDSPSLVPLLRVLGAAHALGIPLDTTVLFAGRVIRPLPDHRPALVDPAAGEVPGVAPWVSSFAVDHVRTAEPPPPLGATPAGTWTVFAPDGHPLAEPLRIALTDAGIGDGVLLCLPDSGEDHLPLILDAGRTAAAPPGHRLVVVGHRFGAAAFARTLHLAAPSLPATVVDLADPAPADPAGLAAAVRRVVADVAATTGFTEVRYDSDGHRTVPVLRALPRQAGVIVSSPLGTTDVLLVTGGGRGMAAAAAAAIAQDSGAAVALLGRADPRTDPELKANLARLADAGVRHRYERVDVTSSADVADAVAGIEAELGAVTAILHGAASDEPAGSDDLDAFRRAVAPKVQGLRAVLAAVDADRIKLLVTFGSIFGRAGLRGAPHHVTADDWTRELTVRFGREHPRTRAVSVAWSVWSGAIAGRRKDLAAALEAEGVTPISTDGALRVLRRVLADPSAGPEILVSGRAPGLALPRQHTGTRTRFVDRTLVHYPGVELVTETDLHADTDPYLADQGGRFPVALGVEAMAQAMAAVTGRHGPVLLTDVEFGEPVTVPHGESTTLRVAALVRDTETVDVVIRGSHSGFAVDHLRATLRQPRPELPTRRPDGRVTPAAVPLDPVTELYGGPLPQGKRFQRLLAIRRLTASRVVAEVATTAPTPWFAPALPQELVAADPGTRDAVLQAVQLCVPDATLVPHGIARLYLSARPDQDTEYVVVDARERNAVGDLHYFDVDVLDPGGTVVERWEGLTLRAVRTVADDGRPWVPALLGPHIERSLRQILGGGQRTVVVEPDPVPPAPASASDVRRRADLAAGRAFGHPVRLRYGPDGQPLGSGTSVATDHGAGLTLLVTGRDPVGCAIGRVPERIPPDRVAEHDAIVTHLMAELGESRAAAGSRVLAALTALHQPGIPTPELTLDRAHPDHWVRLRAGDAAVATWVTNINDRPDLVVFAVTSGEERCHG